MNRHDDSLLQENIFGLSPFPMWIYDLETLRFLAVNKEAERQYGYTNEEFLKMTIADIRPEDEVPKLKKAIEALKSGDVDKDHGLFLHRRKNGTLMKVQIKGSLIKYRQHNAELVIAVDQTERMGLLEELSVQKAKVELIDRGNQLLMESNTLEAAILSLIRLLLKPLVMDRAYYFVGLENRKDKVSKWIRKDYLGDNRLFSMPSVTISGNVHLGTRPRVMDHQDTYWQSLQDLLPVKRLKGTFLFMPIMVNRRCTAFLLLHKSRPMDEEKESYGPFLSSISANISHFAEKWHSYDQMQMSEAKFRALVQGGGELIAVLDKTGRLTYISPSSVNIFGENPEDFQGRDILEFVQPADRHLLSGKMQKAMKTGKARIPAFRALDNKGEIRWFEMKLTNMLGVTGVDGIVANIMDITELKLEQENALMINERYRLATLASKDHIYDMDMESGEVSKMGRALENVFGYPDMGESGYPFTFWKDHIHPEDSRKVLWMLDEFIKSPQKKSLSLNYRFQRANGSYAMVVDYCSAIRDDTGKALRIVGTLRDITKAIHNDRMKNLKFRMSFAIGQPGKLNTSLKRGMGELLDFTGMEMGEVWLKSKDGNHMHLNTSAHKKSRTHHFRSWEHPLNQVTKGQGLPGKVWESATVITWEKLEGNPLFLRSQVAKAAGLSLGIGVPIVHDREIIGVFLVLSAESMDVFRDQRTFLEEIGQQIGAAVKNKLIESELEYFLGISSNLLAIINFEGKIIRSNEAFAKVLGKEQRNISGKHLAAFAIGEDSDRLSAFLDPKDSSGLLEVRMYGEGNQVKWVSWKKNTSNEEKLYYCMGMDITERKKSELALKQAYHRLNSAQRIAKLGYWSRKWEEGVSEWSMETYKIYGVSPKKFIPTYENVLNTFHPQDRHLMEDAPMEELLLGKAMKFTHRIITADDRVRWVTQTVNLLVDEKGSPTQIEGVIQDITEQKEAENRIKLSNERFELAMMATHEMIWDIDHESGNIYRSVALQEKVAYKSTEPFGINNSWMARIEESDRMEAWKSYMLVCGDKTKNYWQKEYKVRTRTGNLVLVRDRCYIIRDEEGMPHRSVGAIEDITAARKHLEIIQVQNSKLREIAWKQSHLVRSPLTNIMIMVNILKEFKSSYMESEREILDHLFAAAENLDEVIHDINSEVLTIENLIIGESGADIHNRDKAKHKN
ncbi:PAS domain S-box protein [Echinicola soli]|uniref:histidine kinase n=1 Tax=Echinicola soli TaxID=2591634 RepID=A0A514CN00_9BACT|nr:PAS domain-containing protein [Echinicola soli]QDH81137.1 PAS domain S-box protein [Echinicola soli]